MPAQQAIEIPPQVQDYLHLHHIVTLGTSSFTGMPHAATTAYVSDQSGLYFSMRPEEMTLRNIEANHWASFTIDNYTPEFRKLRELRGVGRCALVEDPPEQSMAVALFAEKLPNLPSSTLTRLHKITPLVLDFVDFEYTTGVAVPQESSIVYQAAAETTGVPTAISTQLGQRTYEPGQVIVRQGERSNRFFIIVEGDVEVRREGHGQDVIVTRHGAGQLFGEVGALTGAPRRPRSSPSRALSCWPSTARRSRISSHRPLALTCDSEYDRRRISVTPRPPHPRRVGIRTLGGRVRVDTGMVPTGRRTSGSPLNRGVTEHQAFIFATRYVHDPFVRRPIDRT